MGLSRKSNSCFDDRAVGLVLIVLVTVSAFAQTSATSTSSYPLHRFRRARSIPRLAHRRLSPMTSDNSHVTARPTPRSSQPAPGENRVVFFGDSITDIWHLDEYFPGKPYINRGIGGQTTPQMLVRFRQDVIDLHPKVVIILAGTNDIAGNTGPMRLEDIEANYASIAELARAARDQPDLFVRASGPRLHSAIPRFLRATLRRQKFSN